MTALDSKQRRSVTLNVGGVRRRPMPLDVCRNAHLLLERLAFKFEHAAV
jgi:hypothetical protein